jgi:hypothetical protein
VFHHQAVTNVCWLSTPAFFRQPSSLRDLIVRFRTLWRLPGMVALGQR